MYLQVFYIYDIIICIVFQSSTAFGNNTTDFFILALYTVTLLKSQFLLVRIVLIVCVDNLVI